MSIEKGTLYIVATPIGNLGDLSARAVAVLSAVDVIAAEDTRHSAILLRHFGITTRCMALHEHNEREQLVRLLARLREGEAVALISDAGTPLVSDPGYHLVAEAVAQGIVVRPLPGPSALLAALSVAGLPTDRFVFEGFLPARSGARRQRLATLAADTRTLVLYESPHRIQATLDDLVAEFGAQRRVVLCRELTKLHETVLAETLASLVVRVAGDENQRRGEMVLIVHGATPRACEGDAESERVLRILLDDLPLKQAAALAAQITGEKRNRLYQQALALLAERTPFASE